MIFQKRPANNRKNRCNSTPKVFRHTRKTAIVLPLTFTMKPFWTSEMIPAVRYFIPIPKTAETR